MEIDKDCDVSFALSLSLVYITQVRTIKSMATEEINPQVAEHSDYTSIYLLPTRHSHTNGMRAKCVLFFSRHIFVARCAHTTDMSLLGKTTNEKLQIIDLSFEPDDTVVERQSLIQTSLEMKPICMFVRFAFSAPLVFALPFVRYSSPGLQHRIGNIGT